MLEQKREKELNSKIGQGRVSVPILSSVSRQTVSPFTRMYPHFSLLYDFHQKGSKDQTSEACFKAGLIHSPEVIR